MSLVEFNLNRIATLEASLRAANEREERAERDNHELYRITKETGEELDRLRAELAETNNKFRYLEECYERAENDVNTHSRERARLETELAEARKRADTWEWAVGKKDKQIIELVTALNQRDDELAEARRKLAEAEADTRRWDAVEAGHWDVSRNERAGGWIVQRAMQVVGNIGHGRTPRMAVDAAIATQEKSDGK